MLIETGGSPIPHTLELIKPFMIILHGITCSREMRKWREIGSDYIKNSCWSFATGFGVTIASEVDAIYQRFRGICCRCLPELML